MRQLFSLEKKAKAIAFGTSRKIKAIKQLSMVEKLNIMENRLSYSE